MQTVNRRHSRIQSKGTSENYLASLGSVSAWLNLFLLIFCLGIVVYTAQQARWINPSPSLLTILFISMLTGFLTAKSPWPIVLSFSLAAVLGAIVIFWQCLLITPGIDFSARLFHLAANLQLFWNTLNLGLPIPVTIHIAIIFGLLSWLIGYFSSWFFIRQHHPWLSICLGTVMLLVILHFWPGQQYVYFLVFSAGALILLVKSNHNNNISNILNPDRKSNHIHTLWLCIALVVAAAALSFSWFSPGFVIQPVADFARDSNPYREKLDRAWQNFFAQVPGNAPPTLVHGGQTDLVFGGSLTISDQVYFIIEAERQNYWKTQTYDYYDSTGWKTSPTNEDLIEPTSAQNENQTVSESLIYTVIPQIYTNVLPTTGELASADSPVIIKKLAPLIFQIDLSDSSKDSLLPADIASVARSIRSNRFYNRRMTDARLTSMIPADLEVINIDHSGTRIRSITVSRKTEEPAVVAISASEIQAPQQQFSLTVKIDEVVQAEDLAQAGDSYPKEITDRYLQLPAALPSRVKELTESITQDPTTPYDKALALKKYLSQYPYTLTIEAPPLDSDGVDYFLFSQKSGYCTYFASAMTVMLRSAGVPARLVTGFLNTQYLPDAQRSILRDRDYHAWTEVYFPQYGWIILDATPGFANSATVSSLPDFFPTSDYYEYIEEFIEPDIPISSVPPSTTSHRGTNLFVLIGTAVIAGLFFLYWLFSRKIRYGSNLYSGLLFLSSLGGLGPKPWQTPLEFSEQLSSVLPAQASTISRIISHYIIVSYSREKTSGLKEVDKQSWSKLKKALFKRILHTS